MTKPKYSIVIPTYNHFNDCLLPNIQSIIKFTDLSTVEIIIVCNGCTDGTKDYVYSLPQDIFKIIWIPEAAGYTHSTNEGIKVAQGEYVVLLNNDTVLLEQPTNEWLRLLEEPFTKDPLVAITGPLKNFCPHSGRNFIIFFCAMVKREMFDKFGLLDEIYNPGFGEDTDFSIVVQEAGYKIAQVPIDDPLVADMKKEKIVGYFPIYHIAEATLGTMPGGDDLLNKNRKILEDRWKNKKPTYNVVPQLHDFSGQSKKEEHKDPYAHLTKLNLGCGDTILDGYLNADLYNPKAQVKADALQLPFPNERFDELYACHIFEHLNPYKVGEILLEWKRVIKPGGKLIMEMPDILELCKNFEKADKNGRYRLLNCIYGTTQIEHPHVFGWYPEILNDHLIYAGFENILFMPAKVDHWGFNLRVECGKSTGEANKPIVAPAIEKLLEEASTIKLSNEPVEVLNSILPPIPQSLPEGYFSDQDIAIYRSLVSHLPDNGVMAELGCWKGKSLCSIADIILKKNLTVLAVDTWEGTDNLFETFLAEEAKTKNIKDIFSDNMRKFGILKNIKLMQMDTIEASKLVGANSLDFVFIDADHRYECVKNDIHAWMLLLKKDKVIAGHDASWNTVQTAVCEAFDNTGIYMVADLWWAKKLEKQGKVYDCFPFFNELDILEVRLNELDPVVDKFVIVEGTRTYTNGPKPLYFQENKERFAKFAHKIIHVVVDDLPTEGDTWNRERHQRDCISRGLTDCVDGDIIMISDADEIPKMEVVRDYRIEQGPRKFLQQLYYYSLNNKYVNPDLWDWGRILPYKTYRENNMSPCQVRYTQVPPLRAGGWHFSFVGNIEFIKKKISSWAHSEFNKPEINNDENITNAIKTGKDVFGRDMKFEVVKIDETYPKFIQDHKEDLIKKELIRE